MTYLGPIFKFLAYGLWTIIVTVSVIIDLIYVGETASQVGLWGWIVIMPITLVVVPFKALVEVGYMFPMLFTYGGGILGLVLYQIGRMMLAEDLQGR